MSAQPENEIDRLSFVVAQTLAADGQARIQKCQEACSLLLHWIRYLRSSEQTGCCDEMLHSLQGCAVESAGLIAMGLLRPAIFSFRSQIDLAVSWLFYKDHPVEWDGVVSSGEGFLMKRDVFDNLNTYKSDFNARMNVLERHKKRITADPYRLLSAHIHGQSTLVMPKFKRLDDLVYSQEMCDQAIVLQQEVGEYISDIFVCYFGNKWASLPDSVLESVRARVPENKQPILFG